MNSRSCLRGQINENPDLRTGAILAKEAIQRSGFSLTQKAEFLGYANDRQASSRRRLGCGVKGHKQDENILSGRLRPVDGKLYYLL
jgi:hypothetical protein